MSHDEKTCGFNCNSAGQRSAEATDPRVDEIVALVEDNMPLSVEQHVGERIAEILGSRSDTPVQLLCDLVNAGNAYGFTSDQFLSAYKRTRRYLKDRRERATDPGLEDSVIRQLLAERDRLRSQVDSYKKGAESLGKDIDELDKVVVAAAKFLEVEEVYDENSRTYSVAIGDLRAAVEAVTADSSSNEPEKG